MGYREELQRKRGRPLSGSDLERGSEASRRSRCGRRVRVGSSGPASRAFRDHRLLERNGDPPCDLILRSVSTRRTIMKTILAITCLSVLALASPAEAKGCIKGAIAGGVGGRIAGPW